MIEKLTNYEDLEEELIAHTGMNLKDWIKHTTSMFNEQVKKWFDGGNIMVKNNDIERILLMGIGRSGLDNETSIIAKALSELMDYRAIGTVEELQSMKDNGAFTGVELAQLAAMQMKLKDYEAIGTVQGYEDAINSSIDNYNLMKEYKAKVQEFEAIGTIGEFKALKEKSEPKKMSIGNDNGRARKCCGNCGCFVLPTSNYCSKCGQKLDWQ